MRILAIRGRNLASLHGAFEVDFAAGPLARAGLFAISGATGAGKSTLLDALCLALYHQTPRLARASGRGINLPDVGSDTLSPQDPRNLLRRGAGEALAEVDFVGNDHLAYRARWAVRRAGGKPRGRLQQAEVCLLTLPDEAAVGGKLKSEVKEAIEQRIGLNFEQFTRAVLLAQNEFHAFLKAADDERASLLQTLTGTHLFEHISRKAFERARAEREALEQIQARLADQQPLAEEARAELLARQQAAQDEARRLEQEREALAARQRARAHWLQAQEREVQAQRAWQQAQTEQDSAQPRRVQLALVESAQPARPLLAEYQRLQASITSQQQRQPTLQTAHRQATEAATQAQQRQTHAHTALEQARQARHAAEPALAQARGLDARLGELQNHHTQARQLAADADTALAQARAACEETAAQLARILAERGGHQVWLAEHRHLQTLTDPSLHWQARLEEATRRLAEQQAALHQQTVLEARQARQQQALAQLHAQQQQAAAALGERQLAAQLAQAAWQTFDPAQLARLRQEASDALAAATEAQALQQEQDDLGSRRGRLTQTLQLTGQELQACQNRLQTYRVGLPAARARLEQAARALQLARSACADQAEALRAQLAPDTPCPVCGALEHPYGHDAAPQLRQLLLQLEAEHQTAEAHWQALSRDEASDAAKQDALLTQLRQTQTEQDELAAALAKASTRLAASPLATALQAEPPLERPSWLARRIAALRGELDAQHLQEDALHRARQTLDQALARLQEATTTAHLAQTALHKAEAEHASALQAIKHQAKLAAGAAAALAPLLDQLHAALALACGQDWQTQWQGDPTQIQTRCAQLAADWQSRQQAATHLEQEAATLASRCEALEAGLTPLRNNADTAAAQVQAIAAQATDAQARRQTLLGGASVEAYSQTLLSAQQAAEAAFDAAQAIAAEAALARTRAEQNLAQLEASLAEGHHHLATAQAELDNWLRAHPAVGTHEALAALLAHDSDWLQAERQTLQTLAAALTRAASVLEERQIQRRALTPPLAEDLADDAPRQLAEALATHREAIDATRQKENEARLQLHLDDQCHAARGALAESLTQQQTRQDLWARMNELIGSADGKKFRNYAQQITLDVLLAYANHHLAHLAHRYRLERVADSLALLVIDRDMGDERRSVHSLSGGESFLVSLALALALASLSAHRVRVESLFIDEGFGSLDPETLRVAVDALDRLQAQGRKVGIISHVQELTERIGARIEVVRGPAGASRVRVAGQAAAWP